MKQCRRCFVEKPLSEFWKNSRRTDGYDNRCKLCEQPRRLRCARKHKYDRYGITNEQYGEMLSAQNGTCKICKKPETLRDRRGIRSLAVDHDHCTGMVRGLLCARCNRGVGSFRDEPTLLESAALYLRQSKV